MEYRCMIVGDAVAEPFALLRRLLHDSFSAEEESALRRDSLLVIRAREVHGAAVPTHVGPQPDDPRQWTLTMSNPSMPSVDISIRFTVVTNPRRLTELGESGYRGKLTAGGLCGGEGLTGIAGFPLHQPHCIVVCFNPFSPRSFARVRVEWIHVLRSTPPHRSSHPRRHPDADADREEEDARALPPSLLAGSGPRSRALIAAFFSPDDDPYDPARMGGTHAHRAAFTRSPRAASLATRSDTGTGYRRPAPAATVPGSGRGAGMTPVLILVATRGELMREAMESTPSVEPPTPSEVAETAAALRARAYVEMDTYSEDTVESLRRTIARACVGDLSDARAVGYDVTAAERQDTVMRAIEDIQRTAEDASAMTSPVFALDELSVGPLRGGAELPAVLPLVEHSHVAVDTNALDAAGEATTCTAPPPPPPPPPPSPSAERRKSTWTYRLRPLSGRVFYVNRRTRRAQYERPDDYDGKEPEQRVPATLQELEAPSPDTGKGITTTNTSRRSSSSSPRSGASHDTGTPKEAGRPVLPPTAQPSPRSTTTPSRTIIQSEADQGEGAGAKVGVEIVAGVDPAQGELARARLARRERRAAELQRRLTVVEALRVEQRAWLAQRGVDEVRAAHLSQRCREVAAEELRVARAAAEREAALDADIARLQLSVCVDATPKGCVASEGAGGDGELAPCATELQRYAADLDRAEAALRHVLAHVEARERQLWAARGAAARLAGARDTSEREDAAAAAEAQELDAAEARVMREWQDVTGRLAALRDAMGGQRPREKPPLTQSVEATGVDDLHEGDGAGAAVAERYPIHLARVQSEVQSTRTRVTALRAAVGPRALSAAEESQRLTLRCRAVADALVGDLLVAAHGVHRAACTGERLQRWLSQYHACRSRHRALLEEEREALRRLAHARGAARVAERDGPPPDERQRAREPSDGVLERMRHLADRLDRWNDDDDVDSGGGAGVSVMARCEAVVQRVADVCNLRVGAGVVGSAREPASCWAWLEDCASRIAREAGDTESCGVADTSPVSALLSASLRRAVAHGPVARGLAVDPDFLASLQVCARSR